MGFSLWSLVSGRLSSDLRVFPNDDSVRCGDVDGEDGHLSLLDIRRVF